MQSSQAQPQERLQGSIERVTFHSEQSGFCVLRVKIKGNRELVTVVGTAAAVTAGEYIDCYGLWLNDKVHGLQFKAGSLKIIQPSTLEGIEKYLGSGLVKGIGPHFAKKLVSAFGGQVFDVIEQTPERLTECDGIGRKRKEQVVSAWAEQKAVRSIMVFLQSYGVGTARAVRIYKTYGDGAIELVKNNPYRLALDIYGIGFKTADALAERLGITKGSPLRAQAGVRHVLQELCNHGHCAAEYSQLIAASHGLLAIDTAILAEAVAHQIAEGHLIADTIADQQCVYPAPLYTAEVNVAKHLLSLIEGQCPWGVIDTDKALGWVEEKTQLQLSPSQRQALTQVLQHKVSVITGGPGVGKTTIVNSLIKILSAKGQRIALCAPTGRAAKRLTETTGTPAKTIHRLLEFDPKTHRFKYNQDHLLTLDVLIIDESSMLDIVLLNHLLKAVPRQAAVIFVGDIDQLPSVGSGAVLSDLIQSGVIHTVKLTEIFRQASHSRIIVNAHRVNQGDMPLPNHNKDSDFFILYEESPEAIQAKLLELVVTRLPRHYHFDPIMDIQVLTPMHRGNLGSRGLNIELQSQLNGKSLPTVARFGSTFASGDKIIQTVNNYDKEVYNGDIGFIEKIDMEDSTVSVRFEERKVDYDFNELDEIQLAYAISIHKSQGSEFPVVVLPISTQHYTLLARNLLYTGITRGRKLVVLIGQKKAIGMAVRNNKESQRLTKLAERLKGI